VKAKLRLATVSRVCVLLLMLPLMFVACSVEESEQMNPYAQEFAQALEDAPNDYQRAILADGVIRRAELLDAHSRVVDCVAASDSGAVASFREDEYGLFHFEPVAPNDPNANVYGTHLGLGSQASGGLPDANYPDAKYEDVGKCYSEWAGPLDALYNDVMSNPNREDPDELFVECLARHALVSPGFSVDDYKKLFAEYTAQYASNYGLEFEQVEQDGGTDSHMSRVKSMTCEGWCSDEVPPPFVLPSGVTSDDDEYVSCMMAPLR
jgi:hypothetical protein